MHMFHIMRPSVDHRPDFFVPGRALHYNTIVGPRAPARGDTHTHARTHDVLTSCSRSICSESDGAADVPLPFARLVSVPSVILMMMAIGLGFCFLSLNVPVRVVVGGGRLCQPLR